MFKGLILKIMGSKLYKWMLRKFFPYARFSTQYTKITGSVYNEGLQYLRPGYFILTRDNHKASTFFIPGFMSHAAVVVGEPGIYGKVKWPKGYPGFEIAEMTVKNYTKSFFYDICKEADRVLICTCADWSEDDEKQVVKNALKLDDAKYDIHFSLGVKELYCSELVYQADAMGPNKLRVDLSDIAGLGRPYISPDGLLFGENVMVVWDSEDELTYKMGPEVEKYLKVRT